MVFSVHVDRVLEINFQGNSDFVLITDVTGLAAMSCLEGIAPDI